MISEKDAPAAAVVTATGGRGEEVVESPPLALETDEPQRTAEPTATCANCGEPYKPRGPGKPQRFCSPTCRHAYNNSNRREEHGAIKHNAFETRESRVEGGLEPSPQSDGSESLPNPPAETGSFVDHRKNGGPLLLVPESDLKHVDAIGREMAAEDLLKAVVYRLARAGVSPEQVAIVEDCLAGSDTERREGPGSIDWLADDSVCIRTQLAIAVYENEDRNIVIRQERAWCEDEDPTVIVSRDNLEPLIDRLCDLAGIGSAGRSSRSG